MNKRVPVGILGATGYVGQTYVKLLENHPLFEIAFLSASNKWKGHTYLEALQQDGCYGFSEKILRLKLGVLEEIPSYIPLLFSAFKSKETKKKELLLAKKGFVVFSNGSHFRKEMDVPLMIPEINPQHLALILLQRKLRKWTKGAVIAKPNCTLQSFLLPLFPLHRCFGLEKGVITSMQSMSGQGKGFDLEKNIIPHIEGEEEKIEEEPLKILGTLHRNRIVPLKNPLFAVHANRVPVSQGHLVCVSASFKKKPTLKEVIDLWNDFKGMPQEKQLFFAPKKPILYHKEANRPQPALDREAGKGMSVTVGRLRACPIFDIRFTALSHNLIRGAAGGGILTAELMLSEGYL